jgi:hypothetical protein
MGLLVEGYLDGTQVPFSSFIFPSFVFSSFLYLHRLHSHLAHLEGWYPSRHLGLSPEPRNVPLFLGMSRYTLFPSLVNSPRFGKHFPPDI